MSDSRVKCLFCGQVFMVDKEKAGASAPCPACGKETFLDMPDDPGRMESYQIKDSSGVTEDSRDCPACGAPVPGDALVCTQCGYNMETGKKKNTKIVRQSSLSRYAVPVLLMIVSAMAVYIYQESRFEKRLEKARAQWEASAARISAAQLSTAVPAAPAPEAVTEEPAAAEAPPETAAVEAAVQSPEEQASVLAQREQRFRDELDKKSPSYSKSEQVTLVGKTGRVHRGRFIGLKEDVAVLAVEGGTEEVALDQLSHESRLRCDKAYREEFIRRRVQPRR